MKTYRRISKIDLAEEKRSGKKKGLYCGFEGLKEKYSLRPGCCTYIYGSPYSGKTEFWLEILMNLSELHGLRHAIWTPETGTPGNVAAELISKRLRKDFYTQATDKDIYDAQAWLDHHFIIIDEDGLIFSVDEFYDLVDQAEKETGKIHTTTVDPWNEFYHSFADYSGREDKYLEQKLGWIRLNARAKNRHNAIITHVRDQEKRESGGINYYPPATPREMAGGQAWFRKGEAMICVWRPPYLPERYEMNQAEIYIQKAKPKGIGELGECSLFYDKSKNRYYERYEGQDRYANKEEQNFLQTTILDAPF